MELACCQFNIVWEDKEANYRRVGELVSKASLRPDTLLLLPEMFATGFTMNAKRMAERVDGPTAQFLAEQAQRHQIFVQAGLVLADDQGGKPRNETLVFDPHGRQVARYAKMHLFSYAREPEYYSPGNGLATFRFHGAVAAPTICYDLRFPELYRAAAKLGAELITVIACWPEPREEHWLTLLRARAIENQCCVAAVNRVGGDPWGLAYSGRSQIIDPRGRVLVDAGNEEGVVRAGVDLAALREYRAKFPALRDVRPDWMR